VINDIKDFRWHILFLSKIIKKNALQYKAALLLRSVKGNLHETDREILGYIQPK